MNILTETDVPFKFCYLCNVELQELWPQHAHKCHQRLVRGRGIFHCSDCDEDFFDSDHLWQHNTTHQPKGCSTCDSGELQGEVKKHLESVVSPPKHPCYCCDIVFYSKSERTKHLTTAHQVMGYQCKHCDGNFDCQKKLVDHLHGSICTIKMISCNVCQDLVKKIVQYGDHNGVGQKPESGEESVMVAKSVDATNNASISRSKKGKAVSKDEPQKLAALSKISGSGRRVSLRIKKPMKILEKERKSPAAHFSEDTGKIRFSRKRKHSIADNVLKELETCLDDKKQRQPIESASVVMSTDTGLVPDVKLVCEESDQMINQFVGSMLKIVDSEQDTTIGSADNDQFAGEDLESEANNMYHEGGTEENSTMKISEIGENISRECVDDCVWSTFYPEQNQEPPGQSTDTQNLTTGNHNDRTLLASLGDSEHIESNPQTLKATLSGTDEPRKDEDGALVLNQGMHSMHQSENNLSDEGPSKTWNMGKHSAEVECGICEKVFPNRCKLSAHIRTVHREAIGKSDKLPWSQEKVPCQYCGKFYGKGYLITHLKLHEEDTVLCPICGEPFRSIYLERHIGSIHNDPKFVCPVESCGKKFRHKKSLHLHKRRIHDRAKDFVCPFADCDRAFASDSALDSHKRQHTGERPYKCNHCDYASIQNVCLKLHMKNHHSDKIDADSFQYKKKIGFV